MKGQAKKLKRLAIQNELLKNFEQEEDHYEEKKVGNEWLIKMWNGGTNKWQVAKFSEISYKKYKSMGNARKEEEALDEKFKGKIFDDNFKRPTLESIKNMLE